MLPEFDSSPTPSLSREGAQEMLQYPLPVSPLFAREGI